jgi:hypothetical protein
MTFISSVLKAHRWRRYVAQGLDAIARPPADLRFMELAAALNAQCDSNMTAGSGR